MKNLTKLITIVFIVLSTVILLVSCKDTNPNNDNTNGDNSSNTTEIIYNNSPVSLSSIKNNRLYLENKFTKRSITYKQFGQDTPAHLEKKYKTTILLYKDQLPFISLNNYLNMLVDTIDFGSKEFKDGKTATGEKFSYRKYLDYNHKQSTGTLTLFYSENVNGQITDDNESIELNSKTDIVNVSNLDMYNFLEKEEEYEEDGVASKIDIKEEQLTPESEIRKEYSFNLKEDNLDLIEYENDVYAPVALFNQLILPQSYFKVFYNGDELVGIDFGHASSDSSKFTGSNYYADNNIMTYDLKKFDYDFMGFVYKHFYGLEKHTVNGKTYHDYKKMLELQRDIILNGDNQDFQDGIINVVDGLDDLHSFPVIYETIYNTIQLGGDLTPNKGAHLFDNPRTKKYSKDQERFNKLLEADKQNHSYDDLATAYTKDKKTAIITFYDFNDKTRDSIENLFKEIPSTVENVVFNLMNNQGGIVGVFYEIMGYITDKPFETYSVDKMTNRKYKLTIKSLVEKKNYKFYLFTSGVTFSSGNLMTKVFKDNKLGKIYGEKTGGGSSSIVPFLLQSGLYIAMSSKDNKTDSNFIDTEFGVEPDVNVKMEDLFNLDKVQDLMNKNK